MTHVRRVTLTIISAHLVDVYLHSYATVDKLPRGENPHEIIDILRTLSRVCPVGSRVCPVGPNRRCRLTARANAPVDRQQPVDQVNRTLPM